MKTATMIPEVNPDVCTRCGTCVKVCPTFAMTLPEEEYPRVDAETCRACNNCAERCPSYAIKMVPRARAKTVFVDPARFDRKKIAELCRKAKLHPEWVVCYCTGTRAEEVAAAILAGAKNPADLSVMTGVRTGCSIECIQPVLRLLAAAGLEIARAPGWQWYGITATSWDIPAEVRRKYAGKGFHFDDDEKLLTRVVNAPYEEGDK